MNDQPGAKRALFLSTAAFALAFAVWGLLSGLAPILKQQYHLTATQVSLMVAIPVLLGSIGRLPIGLLADRYGPKAVMTTLLLFVALPAFALSVTRSYNGILGWAFLLGIAGAAFAVGVAYVSPWFPKEKQGFALGVFGAGNVGQSIAVFGGPVMAVHWGLSVPFVLFGTFALIWGVVIGLAGENPPVKRPPLSLLEALRPLRAEPLCWLFSLFYFVTFGGFVALAIYLPSMMKEVFHLAPSDAGARTAGFVLLATGIRPLGGWLSDKIGAEKALMGVFAALALLAYGLASANMIVFTTAALSIALCLGLGNGAVFKLVPQHFPTRIGVITGLVGMWGGLGGFFPPLVLGMMKDSLGSYNYGFLLLAAFAGACLFLNYRVLVVGQKRPPIEQPCPNAQSPAQG
jgi:NNP family nitrate/nitrite transporter-like MFS transporter